MNQLILSNFQVHKFASTIAPALGVLDKCGFTISQNDEQIKGVALETTSFIKIWHESANEIFTADKKLDKPLIVFVYQGSMLRKVLEMCGNDCTVKINYVNDTKYQCYAASSMVISSNDGTMSITFMTSPLSLGYETLHYTQETVERFIKPGVHPQKLSMPKALISQLTRLGELVTAENNTYINIHSSEGKLIAYNNNFTYIIDKNYTDNFPLMSFAIDNLRKLDKIDFDTTISYVQELDVHKLVATSADGKLITVFTLLKKFEDSASFRELSKGAADDFSEYFDTEG